ncbi:MAG: hydroxyacid dehydrogenase [Candidatus Harrisonbacteria bacterium CG10_big_fil_rev_8_21_14_0_10_44_23]|uniref:Hydroxyacid dehydrogenase n=1 Tax=Candidatus Harrisonbacteria bacterium CG10_big_fil_rev_8_21_14_0_10_44_23 TaxID=1974585 RepID=A0A2H0UQF5_9BACT|nr:MAG: hydroxyacid dehydrogenase [Candidatus Harrisonbacteria bacterium CG10_big_fil_rev_8_21_14_0_10_44_23]
MKIGFFGILPKDEAYLKAQIQEELKEHEVKVFNQGVNPTSYPKEGDETDFDIISTFVASDLSKEEIAKFPNLKFIATQSTGYDHIDLEFAKKHDIQVSNVPEYGSHTVAEFTFALMLGLARKLPSAYEQIRETGSFNPEKLRGVDLFAKTLGVIGTGKIGQNVIRIARGLEMKVLAYDVAQDESFAATQGFKYCSLDELFSQADIITLHVPCLESTTHMIDAKALEKMKPTTMIINTSRGPIIDTEALLKALQDKKLAGAALDVLEEESAARDEANFLIRGDFEGHDLKDIIANHILIDMENVLVTPHIAYNTDEATHRILDTTIKNIQSFIADEPINIVN